MDRRKEKSHYLIGFLKTLCYMQPLNFSLKFGHQNFPIDILCSKWTSSALFASTVHWSFIEALKIAIQKYRIFIFTNIEITNISVTSLVLNYFRSNILWDVLATTLYRRIVNKFQNFTLNPLPFWKSLVLEGG